VGWQVSLWEVACCRVSKQGHEVGFPPNLQKQTNQGQSKTNQITKFSEMDKPNNKKFANKTHKIC